MKLLSETDTILNIAMINVILVDDHKLVRQGVRLLLECSKDIKVIGEAGNGYQAIDLLKTSHPDVVITDLMMDGMSGIDVVKESKSLAPATKSIVLSMYGDKFWITRAREAGAQGYVLKECSAEDLIDAVHAVFSGKSFISPSINGEHLGN